MAHVRLDSSNDDRWPIRPAEASLVLRGDRLLDGGRLLKSFDGPADALAWLDDERRQDDRFAWVGFLGYELGQLFEPKARHRPPREPVTPPLAFLPVPIDVATPKRQLRIPSADAAAPSDAWSSTFTRDAYLRAVARCVDYIAAGDIFQVNLSQTLRRDTALAAGELYDRLAPATYGGLVDLGDVAVISNSPELFLRVEPDGRIETRPIKGTLPSSASADALLASEKDAAELNMIVDLERNDLGRVCETGSVKVTKSRSVETHPTVHHGVATVAGQLRPGVGLVELLAATFPSGSVTGAPKIRAMQIIDELEPTPRGPYCGAMGRLDADGSLTLNVAIRTATLAGGVLHVPVGGGVVADSQPVAEYDETLAKAAAWLAAAG